MRLIDADYLYNKLVANKCPYDLVLQMVKDEPTVCEIDAISREAVIKILEKYNLEMSKIAEDVSELPSVTQKQEKLTKTDLWNKACSSNRIKRSDIENNNNELSESLIEGYIK